MTNTMTRQEAARVLKISIPTLRKYLAKHRELIDGRLINKARLDDTITKESARALSRQGK
jgi:predicted phage tail protein